jgi:hypothetical protein
MAAVFDFEGLTATSPPAYNGGLTSLSLVDSGLTMSITRQAGSPFDVYDTTVFNGPPASWGTRALDGFAGCSSSQFIANFSAPITGFSLEFGDYGADSDLFTLSAYAGLNGTGPLLGTTTVNYAYNYFPTVGTASLTGLAGAQSVLFIGGSPPCPNSLFYDNIIVSVPEPSPVTLVGLGLAGLLVARLRLRRGRSAVKFAT